MVYKTEFFLRQVKARSVSLGVGPFIDRHCQSHATPIPLHYQEQAVMLSAATEYEARSHTRIHHIMNYHTILPLLMIIKTKAAIFLFFTGFRPSSIYPPTLIPHPPPPNVHTNHKAY